MSLEAKAPAKATTYISKREETDDILTFTLTGINVSIANGLRRTILSDLPTLAFKTFPDSENKANITTNTSRFNNEILKQRLACIPIHGITHDQPYDELEIVIDKKNDKEKYVKFYKEFGVPIREGLYQDFGNKEKLLELIMYKTTISDDEYVSLEEYTLRMKEDQKTIYYITGRVENDIKNSPLLEMYKEKSIEVLIMDHEIDELIAPSINKYKDFDLKSVNRSNAAEDLKTEKDKDKEKELKPLIKKIKKVLGDRVKDVIASTRLSDSPSCIVADANDPTAGMAHIFKAMGQDAMMNFKPILEINPDNDIVLKLKESSNKDLTEDISFLLLEQAMLLEGMELKSKTDFVKRLNRVMGKAI